MPFPTTSNRISRQPFNSLNAVLAGQLKQIIMTRCIQQLCLKCRQRALLAEKSSGHLRDLASFCSRCRDIISTFIAKKSNVKASRIAKKESSTTIADRVMSFVSAVCSGILSSSPVKKAEPSFPSLPRQIDVVRPVTRNKIDSSSIYPYLTALNRPWCRYCGVTVSSKWKDGPWGPSSLCNSHGPDEQGNHLLDLHGFEDEDLSVRLRPILSDYCSLCWKNGLDKDNKTCKGCSLSTHTSCVEQGSHGHTIDGDWFCCPECISDHKKRIVRSKIGFDYRMPFTINPCSSPEPPNRKVIVQPPEEVISVPQFHKIAPIQPRLKRCNHKVERELSTLNDDGLFLSRHHRYECTEKNNHLLRPHIMKRLFPKKAAK